MKNSKEATPKQTKLIKLLIENYGIKGKTKPLGALMIEAGYSKESAKNPHLIIDSEAVQSHLTDYLKLLDDKRRMAINSITKTKLAKASARDGAYVTDTLTKTHQLLSGGATERPEFTLTEEQIKKISQNNLERLDKDN